LGEVKKLLSENLITLPPCPASSALLLDVDIANGWRTPNLAKINCAGVDPGVAMSRRLSFEP
jgi:hypothetical protein